MRRASAETAPRLIYLARRNVAVKWKRPPKDWHAAKAERAIQTGERVTIND